MSTTGLIAKHFREVHFGGNWTASNLKEHLEGVTWEQATTKVHSFNTIATLVYHIGYYVTITMKVFDNEALDGSDKDSFNVPPVNSEDDWQALMQKSFSEAERFAQLIEAMPEEKLDEFLGPEKYGTYGRNLLGIIEHTHYHLGQIVLIKKILQEN